LLLPKNTSPNGNWYHRTAVRGDTARGALDFGFQKRGQKEK